MKKFYDELSDSRYTFKFVKYMLTVFSDLLLERGSITNLYLYFVSFTIKYLFMKRVIKLAIDKKGEGKSNLHYTLNKRLTHYYDRL